MSVRPVLAVLVFAGPAIADGVKSEKLENLAKKLAAVESQLNEDDAQSLEDHISGMERILHRYQAPASAANAAPRQLACLSNGDPGTSEKFNLTDVASGTAIGKASTLQNCNHLLTVQALDLICVSNGDPGTSEKFGVYDLARKQEKGGFTDMKSCQTVVTKAHGAFVCHSNGEPGTSEKFHLFNRETDKNIGGDVPLDRCLASIPR